MARPRETGDRVVVYLWVALGGALGSVARYAVSLGAVRWLGAGFPWGTLLVNVAGSFAIGLLAALATADGRPALGADARAFVMIGILGGFTTFSSFSLETLTLARTGALGAAAANVGLSLVLCLAGVSLGFIAAALVNR
jgi:CrcB protein